MSKIGKKIPVDLALRKPTGDLKEDCLIRDV